jgi:hypothetical protein
VKLKKGESGSWARLDIPATPVKPSTEDPAPKSAVETKVRQLDPVRSGTYGPGRIIFSDLGPTYSIK